MASPASVRSVCAVKADPYGIILVVALLAGLRKGRVCRVRCRDRNAVIGVPSATSSRMLIESSEMLPKRLSEATRRASGVGLTPTIAGHSERRFLFNKYRRAHCLYSVLYSIDREDASQLVASCGICPRKHLRLSSSMECVVFK
ncbi:hypothetical protein ZHAS_00009087 [Anopheles sinensis]|uniref:Uncharacterized protein n=1 Tax=Anopheles sinensis TaxID=74873 RepID=A0A084VU48_ANOSI|nr:hypothetical protein ZHAS_00009087 [Anopheles sinensis]